MAAVAPQVRTERESGSLRRSRPSRSPSGAADKAVPDQGDDMWEAAGTLRSTPLRNGPHRDLPDTGQLTYVLRQRFSYTYDAPVRDLDHRLIVVPPRRHGDQRLRRHSITVSAGNARTTHRRDADGNMVTRSRVPVVPARVEFAVDAGVQRVRP